MYVVENYRQSQPCHSQPEAALSQGMGESDLNQFKIFVKILDTRLQFLKCL